MWMDRAILIGRQVAAPPEEFTSSPRNSFLSPHMVATFYWSQKKPTWRRTKRGNKVFHKFDIWAYGLWQFLLWMFAPTVHDLHYALNSTWSKNASAICRCSHYVRWLKWVEINPNHWSSEKILFDPWMYSPWGFHGQSITAQGQNVKRSDRKEELCTAGY